MWVLDRLFFTWLIEVPATFWRQPPCCLV